MKPTLTALVTALASTLALAASPGSAAAAPLHVTWMKSYRAPGTPLRYDRVGVIKVGSPKARNVLVLEPGTSAGSTYFVPLARWIVARAPGWQAWSVERRENLFEDQSMIDRATAGTASPRAVFNYYLGFLADKRIRHHFALTRHLHLRYAESWGMDVAVQDLHRVILAARRLGGKVVLGGHSLGGAVVTAYATWNFGGHPGARDLAGLVYIDGASRFPAISAQTAEGDLATLRRAGPWLAFGGISAPFAGLFEATGALGALCDPNAPSLGQTFPLLPSYLNPPVRVTNLAQYGYALNVGTSPANLLAAQGHLGRGISPRGPVHRWDGRGALTPIKRFATMFSGFGVTGADGTEWYFPQRLSFDTDAVDEGNDNPAQHVLGMHAIFGHRLPRRLLIYAFAAALGSEGVVASTKILAGQSHIPGSHVTIVDRHLTYAHNDPAAAYPHNAFFAHLIPFLARVARTR